MSNFSNAENNKLKVPKPITNFTSTNIPKIITQYSTPSDYKEDTSDTSDTSDYKEDTSDYEEDTSDTSDSEEDTYFIKTNNSSKKFTPVMTNDPKMKKIPMTCSCTLNYSDLKDFNEEGDIQDEVFIKQSKINNKSQMNTSSRTSNSTPYENISISSSPSFKSPSISTPPENIPIPPSSSSFKFPSISTPSENIPIPSENVSIPSSFFKSSGNNPSENVSIPSSFFKSSDNTSSQMNTPSRANISTPYENVSIPSSFFKSSDNTSSQMNTPSRTSVSTPSENVSIPSSFFKSSGNNPSENVSIPSSFFKSSGNNPSENVSIPSSFFKSSSISENFVNIDDDLESTDDDDDDLEFIDDEPIDHVNIDIRPIKIPSNIDLSESTDDDPANKLTRLTFIERINVNDVYTVKRYINDNNNIDKLMYPEYLKLFIEYLLRLKQPDSDDIINKTNYTTFHPDMDGITIPGRLKCIDTSVFKLQRLIRNSLINNNYIDIDMQNAHLTILSNIFKIYLPNYKNDNRFKYIDILIKHRDDLITLIQYLFMHRNGTKLTKLDCKNLIFGSMYSYQDFYNINYVNRKFNELMHYTIINSIPNRSFVDNLREWFINNDNIQYNVPQSLSRTFYNWFIKNDDIIFNWNNTNSDYYNYYMNNFILLFNNICDNIKNIQIFITLLHEYGVEMTDENQKYSIGKKFTEESHSYISSYNNHEFVGSNEIRAIPNVIPPTTTQKIYFYLYNTSLRQQLSHWCFNNNVDETSANKVFYNTELLEKCYAQFHVTFKLIMNEYEKTLLWYCIKYTMDKLHLNDELHAVLCHDGFMLDRKYFDPNDKEGLLDYATYLCELKNYIESKTGFNINFEYKDHCNEVIDPDNCVHAYDSSNIKCNDQNNYNNEYYRIYSPKTKQEISDITQEWNIYNGPYKLYYDSNKNKYYHLKGKQPQPLPNN